MRELTFFVPGLLGPDSETDLSVSSLEELFRFGALHTAPAEDFSSTLCRLFQVEKTKAGYPVAAITRLVDDDYDRKGIWMRADPVHLRPARDSVVLLDSRLFNLSQYEALVLVAEIKDVFATQGFQLEAPTINRWYAKLPQLPKIKMTPIYEVGGKDIHKYMPTGKDKIVWDKFANEIQMVLHASPLNQAREQRGDLLINGLWLWGLGALPPAPPRIWQRVFGDEEIIQGLCLLSGSAYEPLPDSFADVSARVDDEDVMVVFSAGLRYRQYSDIEGWQNFMRSLEEKWFTPILAALRDKELAHLVLLTGYKKLVLNQSSFMKFWRKHKGLRNYR